MAGQQSIGALWERTSKKGQKFLSGKIEGIGDVVVFANDKDDNAKKPDWKIFKSEPMD
jgi:hypothetical protein